MLQKYIFFNIYPKPPAELNKENRAASRSTILDVSGCSLVGSPLKKKLPLLQIDLPKLNRLTARTQ